MEAGFIALLVVAVVVGIVVGIAIERKRKIRYESRGTLFADYSNPDCEPSLYLQAVVPASEIASQKHVIFDVRVIR